MEANKKNSVRNNQVINDFGQKIGGAHKDRAREAAERLAGVDAPALIAKPLGQVAKLPDLRALHASGVITEETARRAWYLWSQIGQKPGSARPWRVREWAEKAATLIAAVADVLAYGYSEESQIPEDFRPLQSWDLFLQEMTAANWPADEYKRGAYFVGLHWMGSGAYSIHSEKSSYSQKYATVAECVAAIRTKIGDAAANGGPKFSVYKNRAGVYFIAPEGKPGIKLFEYATSAEAWAAYGDREKLAARYNELRTFPSERRDWNRPRVGADHRQGQDLSPESFAAVFPFRGVEFGNWVNQIERSACLNEAADALHDMADIIGIRPEAVALGGSLAWAFGSRGVGKALAHYEHARRVVNLTKKKGNGCVAHEWFHALDNYIMLQEGRDLMAVSDSSAYGDSEKSPIRRAAYDLKKALNASPMYSRAKRIDEFKAKPYWATVTEMAARAFEAHIFYRLEAAGMCNDYLVNFKPLEEWARPDCYPYPTREESAELAPLFDAFILAAFGDADRVIAPAMVGAAAAPQVAASEPMDADNDPSLTNEVAQGEAYGDCEKSQNHENLPKSLQEWEKSSLRDEVEQIAREMGFTPSRYCPRTLFFLRDKNGEAERNSRGEALTVSISPSYPMGLNDMPGMWYRKGYIDRVLSSYWSVGVEAHCQEYSAMKYNPTEKPDPERRRMVIDFDWMLEATAENFRRIMEEILRRFRESDPAPTNNPAPTDGVTGATYGDTEKSQTQDAPTVEGVEVVGYSDKALAVFGDTRALADELKAIGAKFNRALTYNGERRAGWIISRKKADELAEVLAVPQNQETEQEADGAAVPALPESPAAVVYNPAQPIERAEFVAVDAEGAPYGEGEKSLISINPGDIYKVVAADRIVIVLERLKIILEIQT